MCIRLCACTCEHLKGFRRRTMQSTGDKRTSTWEIKGHCDTTQTDRHCALSICVHSLYTCMYMDKCLHVNSVKLAQA